MYAIVETGGKQYWVNAGETLQVNKLEAKQGDVVELKALWASKEEPESETPGSPKAKVTAEVVRQMRGEKIIVFKKRPKSRYRRRKGHRQWLTELRIKDISFN
jgi:large subunit ribosomal protein L21